MRDSWRRVFPLLLLAILLATGSAEAQFGSFGAEQTETKWGGAIYAGGEVDSTDNIQFGLRGSYRLLQLDDYGRISPELGIEVRKNYVLFKAGGRGDTRELYRLSGFGSAGVLTMNDFTTADNELGSVQTWYVNFGGKIRLPELGGIPVLGRWLGGLPLDDTSLYVAEEITGIERPTREELGDRTLEHSVNEWYGYSIQIGLMVGSASGMHSLE